MELQHLTTKPIARVALNEKQTKLDKLVRRNNQLEQIMTELRQQSKVLRGKLDSTEGSKENLAAELASIKEISSDVIALNEQNQGLVKFNLRGSQYEVVFLEPLQYVILHSGGRTGTRSELEAFKL